MNLQELLERLDIETPDRLEYFEQYAELAETNDYIPVDTLIEFFEDADADILRELTEAYFEEILSGVPDSGTELYLLITSIGRALSGLAGDAYDSEDADGQHSYAEEFFRFRRWYVEEPNVRCGAGRLSVLEALATIRAGKLTGHGDEGGAEEEFDFSDTLDYEIDEYAVSLSELLDE
jgi:hypothetical protein